MWETRREIDGLDGTHVFNKNSFQFCWRCLRPWRRETHEDFFSCTLAPAQMLQGAWVGGFGIVGMGYRETLAVSDRSTNTTDTTQPTGAADAFDHHDKKATALVALRNRALELQRRLRALPPSTPAPSRLLPIVAAAIGGAPPPSPVEADLAIEALETVQVRFEAVLWHEAFLPHSSILHTNT